MKKYNYLVHNLGLSRCVQCRISDPIRNFRISELFGSDHWVFRSGTVFGSDHWIFRSGSLTCLKNPDPHPIRKPEIFSGYPIRNIRNLKIGSDIRNFETADFRIGCFCTPLGLRS